MSDQEIKKDLEVIMELDNSSALSLLYIQSLALVAAANKSITHEQLMDITDNVEKTSKMDKGIDRDLSFESARKSLKTMLNE